MKKIIILLLIITGFTSCSDFLDTVPDNRTQIDNLDKVKALLVSAYPTRYYGASSILYATAHTCLVFNNNNNNNNYCYSGPSTNIHVSPVHAEGTLYVILTAEQDRKSVV